MVAPRIPQLVPLVPPAVQILRLLSGFEMGGLTSVGPVDGDDRPVLLELTDGAQIWRLRAFCWNVTHGGGTRSDQEYRVQTTRPRQVPFYVPEMTTLLLGYDNDRDVFAAWNAERHPNPSTSSSLQVMGSALETAQESGFVAYPRELSDSTVELVVAFRPEFTSTYLRSLDALNPTTAEDANATSLALEGSTPLLDNLPGGFERRRKIVSASIAVRDARFRSRVVAAYEGACAFCGLGAGLVEAAHVVPVSTGGSDEPANGVAACPTHHAAFDRGLIVVGDDLSITVNEQRILSGGWSLVDAGTLEVGLLPKLRVPQMRSLAPDPRGFRLHSTRWAVPPRA
jgi:putative restriction endonuclease